MSSSKRKICYYSIEFKDDDNKFFDPNLFMDYFDFLSNICEADRIVNDTKIAKAQELYSVDKTFVQGKTLLKVVFKSCKYNHSPELMSSIDGSERESDKQPFEGEKELTHMCMDITISEAFTIFEDRKNGVSISQVIKYLNTWLQKYMDYKGINKDFNIIYGIIPSDDFLQSLHNTDRITMAELYTERSLIGSGYFNLMDLDDNTHDDIVIQIKAKRKQSISKHSILQAYNRIISSNSKVNRIRVYAKDDQNMNVVLDSINAKKKQEIIVELKENGTVDSYSIFSKMEDILGVTE